MKDDTPLVLKVGGGEVDDLGFLKALAEAVGSMERRPVVVHGGGKEIGLWLKAVGQEPRFHQGLRITDDQAMSVVEMVLSGRVNKRLVGALVAAGVQALGLSGRDLGLVSAGKLQAEVDLGHVGEPQKVKPEVLTLLCGMGIVPVVSPVSQDAEGVVYNINADHVAAALAGALGANELVFLSNVPGVLNADGEPLPSLTGARIEQLIEQGVIAGGMLPKVRSGIEALNAGVRKVLITNLEGLHHYLDGKPAATVMLP
jgi:acetylglutamate kinase